MYGLSEYPEGIYQTGFLIQQIRIEIFLPRLLFFRAPVVIDGKERFRGRINEVLLRRLLNKRSS